GPIVPTPIPRSEAPARSVVGVEGVVELDRLPSARASHDLAGLTVAEEQEAALAREMARLHHAVGREHRRRRRDVQTGLDDAVVAEADADTRVGPQQAPLTDRDDLLAATGQRAHDRRAAAHVGAVADD